MKHKTALSTTTIVVLLLLLLAGAGNVLVSNQALLVDILMFAALTQGVNMLYGYTGYMPFGYVAFFGVGAYGFAISVKSLGLDPWLALLCGGVCGMILCILIAPLLRLKGAYFAIATLAAAMAVKELIANPALTPITQGPYGMDVSDVLAASKSYWSLTVILVLSTVAAAYLKFSRFGLSLRAGRDNERSAATAGIDVVRGRVVTLCGSGLIGGLTGAAYAWNIAFFYPDAVFGVNLSLFPVIFVIFGGAGTVLGPLVGAAILYSLYVFVGVSNPQYFQLLYGILIVFLLLFAPGGIAAILRRIGIRVF